MSGYFQENPEWVAKMDVLKADAAAVHNACHDWLIANPLAEKAPDDLRTDLMLAEQRIEDHRRHERERYFRDMAEQHPDYVKPRRAPCE